MGCYWRIQFGFPSRQGLADVAGIGQLLVEMTPTTQRQLYGSSVIFGD
jgi:hypothetical protein